MSPADMGDQEDEEKTRFVDSCNELCTTQENRLKHISIDVEFLFKELSGRTVRKILGTAHRWNWQMVRITTIQC